MSNTMMSALVTLGDGFSGKSEGPAIESLDPYLEYKTIDIPEPGEGEVLVKVAMASINPSDLHFIKGEYGIPRRAGVPAGFEAVGEVISAGKGGEGLVGKRVSCFGSASGVWAEYAIAAVPTCIPLRDDVRDEDAAAMLVNPLTAIGMYEEAVSNGNDAFIMTAAASQLCKLISGLAKEDGKQAISIVRRDEHIEPLKALGSSHVLNCTADGFSEELGGIIKALKPRMMLDAVADQISSSIFTAMPSRSRWMIYGKLSTDMPKLEQPGQFVFMGKQIEGFWLTQWMKNKPVQDQIAASMRVQELFATGKWKTDVAAVIPLAEAHAKVPEAVSGMNTGKVMLVP